MSSKPMFRRVVQVAMVVRDIDATVKRYWEDLGIGPWRINTLSPSNTPNMTYRGKPVKHAFRTAIARVADISLELIQPLDGDSLYAEHLAAHGEGLHHIAFDVENFAAARAHLKRRGYTEIQGGRPYDVGEYAYFDTDKGLACITEFGAIDAGKVYPLPPQAVYP